MLLSVIVVTIGCGEGKISEQLAQIDSLLVHDKVDSALVKLSDIRLSNASQADSAYYYLIRTEARYRANVVCSEDSIINYSVNYYNKTSDTEKKARSYYYQGVTLYLMTNDLAASILLVKMAEENARGTDNLLLKHKIYETLSHYNSRAYEYKLALSYAKKAMQVSKVLGDKERQAIALLYMAGDYSRLDKMDSLAICVQQCLSLADYITERDKAYLYTRMGELYAEKEPDMAKKYLLKAVDIYPQSWTYLALSNIYLKEQNVGEAQKIWDKALQMSEGIKARIDIFKAMRQQSIERKDFEQANALADSILDRQQKFSEVQEQERIMEIQAKYDKEAAEKEFWNIIKTWGLGIIALIAVIIGILSHLSYKGMKDKKELAESKIQLEAYTKKAAELENSGKASAAEINKLHEKISDLTQRHSGILAKGRELYDAIEAGGTTVHWGKNDFINYLEYYKMKDLPFVNEMETEYDRLSPKYIFFSVLEHDGKTDEDIQRIMGISESTLRSTRSRINSKKLSS